MDNKGLLNLDKTIQITLHENCSYKNGIGNIINGDAIYSCNDFTKIIPYIRSQEKYILWKFGSFYQFGPKCRKIFEDNFMNGDSIYIEYTLATDNQDLLSSLVDKRFDKITIEFNFIISEEDRL